MNRLSVKVEIEGLERLKKAIESLESAVKEYEEAVAQVGVRKEATTVTVVAPRILNYGDISDVQSQLLQTIVQQLDQYKPLNSGS
ncbi:hypothetical protein PAV_11c01180 [Paenibacillus alvei DSM 29]|nr:hypothetical protein PAV_11c01180 [Paenibacillus alvei DSM 29]